MEELFDTFISGRVEDIEKVLSKFNISLYENNRCKTFNELLYEIRRIEEEYINTDYNEKITEEHLNLNHKLEKHQRIDELLDKYNDFIILSKLVEDDSYLDRAEEILKMLKDISK